MEEQMRNLEEANKVMMQELAYCRVNKEKNAAAKRDRERERALSASLAVSRLGTDASDISQRACTGTATPAIARTKIYRDRGCQVNTISMEAASPAITAAQMCDHKALSSSISSRSLLPSSAAARGHPHATELDAIPYSCQREETGPDLLTVPEHIIADVKQYYVDNLLR